ncbi:MAG: gamma-glutamylcyclotransferase [Actinomycetota bacterium]
MPDLHLFVYGTLRSESPHPMARRLRSGAKLLGKARAVGVLYDLGYYPGATFTPEHRTRVLGEVFIIQPASPLKAALDMYEGAETDAISSVYGPVEIEVELERGGTRLAVVYALRCIPRYAKPVESGDWISHCRIRAARPRRG